MTTQPPKNPPNKKPIPGQREKDLQAPHLIQRYWDKFFQLHPLDAARHSAEALDWFRKRVSKDLKVRADQVIKNSADDYQRYEEKHDRSMIGKLFLYEYEAVTAGDIENNVYDRYPMVFFFNITKSKEGKLLYWGLNMHYLTPKERAAVYSGLIKLKNAKGYTPKTKLRLQWDLIKTVCKMPLVDRAVHAYRADRIQSRIVEIPATDWPVALFLRIERWMSISGDHPSASQGRNNIRLKARIKKPTLR